MLHAPVNNNKQRPDALRNQLAPQPQPDLGPTFAASWAAVPASGPSASPRMQHFSRMQSIYGNRAVLRMLNTSHPALQAKLAVNQPGDPFEQEADRVADQVMRMPAPVGLQRKCSSCAAEEEKLQRKEAHPGLGSSVGSAIHSRGSPAKGLHEDGLHRSANVAPWPSVPNRNHSANLPPGIRQGLESPGQFLEPNTRAEMESLFGFDFQNIRVHAGGNASASARSVNALAYTAGSDIVFGAGQYAPSTASGRRLLAHELAHTIQQRGTHVPPVAPPLFQRLPDGGVRLAVAPVIGREPDHLEHEADAVADQANRNTTSAPVGTTLSSAQSGQSLVQRVRFPLPSPQPLCGKTLTDIDILPWATKDLEPCLPKGTPVTRVNIIGRDMTVPSPGAGNQVFNLHVGYYTNAAGEYCGVVRDSKACVAPPCLFLGCFPTLDEVLEAIWKYIKTALVMLGVILLAIVIAAIIALLGEILVPAAALAQADGAGGGSGGGDSDGGDGGNGQASGSGTTAVA